MTRRILVLGANGQVGHELPRALADLGAVVSLDRSGADLSRPELLRQVVRRHQPAVIVNAAAYTAVDRAETEPDLADTINGVAPGVLAEEARAIDACLVHYSSDYVFDGRKEAPYVEADAPHPVSAYGRSKLAGERAVASVGARHLIFRTSWVVGVHGTNFLKTMLRLAAERDSVRVVADQFGAPTSAALIADVTSRVLRALIGAPGEDSRWGLYHLAAAGETSWHAYARYVIERAAQHGMSLKASPEDITPIRTDEYSVKAARPANSRLSTARLRSTFGLDLPHWTNGVDDVLDQLQLELQR